MCLGLDLQPSLRAKFTTDHKTCCFQHLQPQMPSAGMYNPKWTAGCLRWGHLGPKTQVQRGLYKCKESWVIQSNLFKQQWIQKCQTPILCHALTNPKSCWVWYPRPSHLTTRDEAKSHFCLFLSIILTNAQRSQPGQWKIWVFIPALWKKECEPVTLHEPASQMCVAGWISHRPIHPTQPVMNKNWR